ncbi:MAG TPA: hypothetical protein VKX17_04870 [Planctomycetota bacterium]|nr:hypothetical protein [Planctomycetota bacterium]
MDVATAEGTWELHKDKWHRSLLTLRLKDRFNGQTTADFAPEELQNESHMSSRFNVLKSALIRVGHWRELLRQLFSTIREWSRELPGTPHFEEDAIELYEERSGRYEVPRLIITSNGQSMRIEPVAAWVVGADGRVDMKGTGGPLILIYRETEKRWFYFQQFPAAEIPLTKDVFVRLAEACLNG